MIIKIKIRLISFKIIKKIVSFILLINLVITHQTY